jgi:hypothetical protein
MEQPAASALLEEDVESEQAADTNNATKANQSARMNLAMIDRSATASCGRQGALGKRRVKKGLRRWCSGVRVYVTVGPIRGKRCPAPG